MNLLQVIAWTILVGFIIGIISLITAKHTGMGFWGMILVSMVLSLLGFIVLWIKLGIL